MSERRPRFCHLCGGRLAGSYAMYPNGLVCCERCEQSAPRCGLCGLPSRPTTPVRGKNLCQQCLALLPVCTHCREAIVERYLDIEGGPLCEPCALAAPHCGMCAQPHPRLGAARGQLICPSCRAQLPVCACCREPILAGATTKLGDSPLIYCEPCLQGRPRCGVCSAPLDEQGVVLQASHGEVRRCATCYSTAVRSWQEAEQLYREAYALLGSEVGLELEKEPPALHLVERATLVELHRRNAAQTEADAALDPDQYHLHGCFSRRGKLREVFIELLLPRSLFLAVAAHELGHSWQSSHAPQTQSRKLYEGFAHWVAWCVLRSKGEVRESARLTRSDDHYGEGLQYFISLERQLGRGGVIEQAALLSDVPALP